MSDLDAVTPEMFALYAGTDLVRWRQIEGARVWHSLLGAGEVVRIADYDSEPRIYVAFDGVLPVEAKKFAPAAFKAEYFSRLDLPAGLDERDVREAVAKVRAQEEEHRRAAALQELRRSQEREHDFARRLASGDVSARRERARQLLQEIAVIDSGDTRAPEVLRELEELLSRSSAQERHAYVVKLPLWVRSTSSFFRLLATMPALEQVELIWDLLQRNGREVWEMLPEQTKLLCIFKAAAEGHEWKYLVGDATQAEREHPLIQFALRTWALRASGERRNTLFARAHDQFQDWVVKAAWSPSVGSQLHSLLPTCAMGLVQYCEAKAWPTEDDRKAASTRISRAYCPRGRGPCTLSSTRKPPAPGYPLAGARLYPERSRHWKDWSLLELLEVSTITPLTAELREPLDYVPTLSGWINRLNEIRGRMRCSRCKAVMAPNGGYAKHLAVYRVTVFSCPSGAGHDLDVYLTHCWGCRALLDSRESRIRVEDRYLCIHCGSGPQRSRTYSQGDFCPKCGTSNMEPIDQWASRMSPVKCVNGVSGWFSPSW